MKRLARPFAITALALTVACAIGAVAVRILDPAPVVPSSLGFGDASLVAFEALGLAFASVGALLVLRQPGNSVGWLMLLIGCTFAASGLFAAITFSAAVRPSAVNVTAFTAWLTQLMTMFSFALFWLALVFPTGRGTTRGWDRFVRWSVAVMIVAVTLILIQPGPLQVFPTVDNPLGIDVDLRPLFGVQVSQLIVALSVFMAPVGAWALISRYRSSNVVVRSQLKWFALSMLVAMVAFAVAAFVATFLGRPPEIALVVFGFAATLIPIAIGIAILRHGLYDIDRLVSRTISYGLVTGVLGAVFAVSVVALSAVLGSLAEGNSIAVALSTLLVAGLFGPIRRRAQAAVDRRFDRAAYDAARTIASLAGRLRDDRAIDRVEADVVGLVDRTFRPSVTALWLRPRGARRADSVTISGRPVDTVVRT